MKKRSDPTTAGLKTPAAKATSTPSRGEALTHLIGLGEQSVRKSYYPELLTKLEELEQERDRYSQLNATLEQLNEELEVRVEERTQELQSVNEQLRQEIAERQQIEIQLKQAKEAAEEANRNKDKYFAAASHDLLQPMNAARLLVSALRERTLAPADEGLVERVHLALENAEDLINDLLDISRLDQNAITPDLSSMQLNALLHSLDAEFQPVAQVKKLKLNILPTSLAVCSDSRLLMRILRNLISNAIRYTPEGRITVGCRRTPEHVLIQIWDTGDGIPADQLEMIFKEFQQLDQHRGKNRQGLGLGLAIVDRIARMLGHPVQVESLQGQGSCF
ncbi:MAG: HAMP domain-containing sensor histidine kinase, partial [Oceanospirillum sp.]|nr:HAMP domain-containing sensor histidine kinase [Oceanospirillum sp.]